jgi:hypothetical protein
MTGNYPTLDEMGWGYPKELLGTRSQSSVTVRPLRSLERDVKIDFRRKHIDAQEDVIYEIAMRREDTPASYDRPPELIALVRHLQGWIETNSAAMRTTQGFWMEYLGTDYPLPTTPNPRIYIAQVRLRFRSIRGTS